MRRREFIRLIGGTAAAWPVVAKAQQPVDIPRIGVVRFGPATAYVDRVEALRSGLRQNGYIEGKNNIIEFRWAETIHQLSEMAADLVRMNVDVIFATSSTEVEAARQATKTISCSQRMPTPWVSGMWLAWPGLAGTSQAFRCCSPSLSLRSLRH